MRTAQQQINEAIVAASELGVIGQALQESGESVIQGEIMQRYARCIENALQEAVVMVESAGHSCRVAEIREDAGGAWVDLDLPSEFLDRVKCEAAERREMPSVTLARMLEDGARSHR